MRKAIEHRKLLLQILLRRFEPPQVRYRLIMIGIELCEIPLDPIPFRERSSLEAAGRGP